MYIYVYISSNSNMILSTFPADLLLITIIFLHKDKKQINPIHFNIQPRTITFYLSIHQYQILLLHTVC